MQPTYLFHFSLHLSGQYANQYERDKDKIESPVKGHC